MQLRAAELVDGPKRPLFATYGRNPFSQQRRQQPRQVQNMQQQDQDASGDETFDADWINAGKSSSSSSSSSGGTNRSANPSTLNLKWSDGQLRAIKLILEQRQNVFLTGCAGTGKSAVIAHLVSQLPAASTFVTATTGVAAVLVGGTTLHRFAGIGIGEGSVDDLVRRANSGKARLSWSKAKILIVDEVSMLDADLLDKLENVARQMKKRDEPFGGIQLVFCGDFFQLPPVGRGKSHAFAARCWPLLFPDVEHNVVQLEVVFRQADLSFVGLLDEIRHGRCSDALELRMRARMLDPGSAEEETWQEEIRSDGIEPTVVYTHNRDVETINAQKLAELPKTGPVYRYAAIDSGPQQQLEANFDKGGVGPVKLLVLKQGAQVALCYNVDVQRGLGNGCRGVVIGFSGQQDADSSGRKASQAYPIVKFTGGEIATIEPQHFRITAGDTEVCSRKQIPLRLAWAVTVHKSQGQTLTRAVLKLSGTFEDGQAYVALSRVKSFTSFKLIDGFSRNCVRASAAVINYYAHFEVSPNLISSVAKSTASPSLDDDVFRCEIAPSGRAKCRQCQNMIELHAVRIGRMISGRGAHMFPVWCHLHCFPRSSLASSPPFLIGTRQFGRDWQLLPAPARMEVLDALNLVDDSIRKASSLVDIMTTTASDAVDLTFDDMLGLQADHADESGHFRSQHNTFESVIDLDSDSQKEISPRSTDLVDPSPAKRPRLGRSEAEFFFASNRRLWDTRDLASLPALSSESPSRLGAIARSFSPIPKNASSLQTSTGHTTMAHFQLSERGLQTSQQNRLSLFAAFQEQIARETPPKSASDCIDLADSC